MANQSRKVDWVKAKRQYMEDNTMTYGKLAKKWGVTRTAIEHQMAKEDTTWSQQRKELADKAELQWQDKIVDEASQVNDNHLKQWRNLQAVANKAVVNLHAQQHPNVSQLKDVAKVLQTAINGERVIMGMATSVQAMQHSGKDGEPLEVTLNKLEESDYNAVGSAAKQQMVAAKQSVQDKG